MSEMPNCVAGRSGCKMLLELNVPCMGIKEINQKLRISNPGMTESNANVSGLINVTSAVAACRTALKMQRKVSGCTIEVNKCIQ